jgi:hypothetical protein
MIFETIVTKSELVQIFLDRGIASESTVNKLASGNSCGDGFTGFPHGLRVGSTRVWKREELERWLSQKLSQGELEAEGQSLEAVEFKVGKGRPTRKERQAAAAAGLTVSKWRAQQLAARLDAEPSK